MIGIVKKRIGVKVSLLVNFFLVIILSLGTAYMINKQSNSLEQQLLERGRFLSMIGAKSVGTILEEAIDNGVFSINDALDTEYVEIPGFDPPKYHTKYDFYLDKAILALQDEFLKDESVVFAVAVDKNGYLPTHNTRFQQAITGDTEIDLKGNRTKRIFNDPVGINAAKNTEEGFLQKYYRDTGEVMWDISSPVYVKGRHWGAFRIGYSLEAINAAKADLTLSLVTIMVVVLLFSVFFVMVVVNRALTPLRRFTNVASDLADGKVDQKIEVSSEDEIGRLADVLERLRMSIKVAMERLSRK